MDVDVDLGDDDLDDFDLGEEEDLVEEDLNVINELRDNEKSEEDDQEDEGSEDESDSAVNKLKGFFGKLKRKDKSVNDDEFEVDDEEVEDKVDSGKTLKIGIAEKLPFLSKILNKDKSEAPEEELDLDSSEASDSNSKKKFKLTKIHAIVIVIVVFLALNWSEDEQVESNKTPPAKVKRKPIPREIPAKKDLEQTPKPVEKNTPDDSDPKAVEVKELEIPIEEEPLEEIPTEEVTDSTPAQTEQVNLDDIKLKDDQPIEEVVPEPVAGDVALEPKVKEATVETVDLSDEISSLNEENKEVTPKVNNDSIVAPSAEKDNSSESDTNIYSEETNLTDLSTDVVESDISTDITKQLLKDLEIKLKEEKKELEVVEVLRPVSAPSYETIGEGLVYNCKGGHWACIEKEGYKKCRQNYSWNKNQNVKSECYPYAVLDNDLDCAAVQQEKINGASDTDFCK